MNLEPADLAALVRRSRLAAAVGAAIGTSCYLVGALGSMPDAAVGALLVVPILLAIAHQLVFRQLGWRSARAPQAFLLDRNGFAAARPQTPYGAGLIIGCALVAGRLATIEGKLTALGGLAFFTAVTIWCGTRLFLGPYLVIGPAGLTVGTNTIRWDAVWPEGPPAPGKFARSLRVPVVPGTSGADRPGVSASSWDRLRERGLNEEVDELLANDPSLVKEGPPSVPIDLRWVTVDRTFLAGAIRYYRANPEARPAIGTEAGHAQLATR
ncbi:hypothetical protein [Cryptosporangium sp. NPDC051539]|uniref:hypothetical protein n=1 Tax=Cryptosporangium sp. NPDC051539 TaxID=3363962 RepID=UPI00378AD925